ncbi:MAG: response regulator [Phycisphaeraceae bacterium]|nr:response regulator [Phycisphaeraceae bacterium]
MKPDDARYALSDRYDVVTDHAADAPIGGDGVDAVLVDADALPAVRTLGGVPLSQVLLDSIGEGVCLASGDGRVLWSNRFYDSLPEEIRRGMAGVCIESSAWLRDHPTAGGAGAPAPASCKFELVSGSAKGAAAERVYEVFVSPVIAAGTTEGSRVERLAVVVRDVTAASRIKAKMDAISRAGAELVRIEADAIRKKNVVERLSTLEQKIVHHTADLLAFDRLVIRLIDEASRRLEVVMSSDAQPTRETECYAEPEGSGILGRVAATGTPYLCRDCRLDENAVYSSEDARSSLTVPLMLHDRLLGVMQLESKQPSAYTDEDLQFLEIFSRHVAVALHMLDLLIVERSAVNQSVTGRVEGELDEPLADLFGEIQWLDQAATAAPEMASHVARIRADVESIRTRVRECATGPQTLLGVDRALAAREKDPALVGRRVLIADNEEKIRRIIADVLTNRGCRVSIAGSGGEAITLLEKAGAGEIDGFELVLSDIKMPDHNGYEVFAAARVACPTAPVILMTGFGYDPHHSIVRASQEGLQSVLFKPFQVERLVDEVRKALGGDGKQAT